MIGALLKHRKNVILYCYIVLSCLKLYDIAKTLYFNRNKLHENSYIYIVILLYMLLYLSIVMLYVIILLYVVLYYVRHCKHFIFQ